MTKKQIRTAIGANLKAIRVKAEVSQQALADALGIHQVTIARWESGSRSPAIDELPAIAAVLRVSPSSLGGKILEKIPD
jgi:transcriptional regulator with XRE-family HTH domain